MKKKLLKLTLPLFILFIVVEVGLRIIGIAKTHSEKNFGVFINPFSQTTDTPYWLWSEDDIITISNADFEYDYLTNSMGLVDKDIDTSKTDHTLAFLGDSFTQGSGAPSDSSMPRLFEQELRMLDSNAVVLNAGIPASDVFFFTKLIENKLMPLGIKKYVVCVNTSDLYDYIWRGGAERFLADGSTTTRKAPWYFPIYHYSHFFRAVFHGVFRFDHSYVTSKRENALKAEAAVKFSEELKRMNDLMDKSGDEMVVMLQPHPAQYSNGNQGHLDDWVHLQRLYELLLDEGVNVVNLENAFSKRLNNDNYLHYSWLVDQHFNSRGYQMYADIIFNALSENYPEIMFEQNNEAEAVETE